MTLIMPHPSLAQCPNHQGSGNPETDALSGARWAEAMRAGVFADAWAISDAVLRARDPATRDDPALPYHLRWLWDGRPLDGRRVLVRCYHGLGDTLQFCRYLPLLRTRVAELTLEAQPELLPLLRALSGPDRVIPFRPDAPAPAAECDIEIMELAHALRLVPDGKPYLVAEPLPRRAKDLLVGLCWQAGGWDPGRSVPLAAFEPVSQLAGAQFVSLQRGPGLDDLAGGAAWPLDTGDRSTDVMAVARLIAALDLVITVDTMVAHLAAALGRPTWVLLQADADWRWMRGRSTLWYDRARLYRQSSPGDWAAPLAEISRDLAVLVQRAAPGNPKAIWGL